MRTPGRVALATTAATLLLAAAPAAAHPVGPPPPPQWRPSPHRAPIGGALRVGADVPSGPIYAGERLRQQFGTQLGVLGELGVRVSPQLLVGGYLGFGIGSAGSRFDGACVDRCGSGSFRAGFLAQYDFAPFAQVSPWVGYGVGFAAAAASGDEPGARFRYSYAGIEVAHLMAGIDLRPGGRVGLGLYADWIFGVYRRYHWDELGATVAEGSVRDPTVHQWFSIGPRISF